MMPFLALLLAIGGPTNVISRVAVEDMGAAIEVTISGSRLPSFTTFAARERFVIDLPDTLLQVPAVATAPEGMVLREVLAEQRMAEGVRQARVTLSFSSAVEPPRVRARGNDLVLRIT